MKEESRIEALEHEVKILKNEIQATLLEIREQVLNHYYPELRAEEPLRSLSLPVRPTVGRPGLSNKAPSRSPEPINTLSEITAKGQVQPFSDIFLEDLEDDDDDQDLDALLHPQQSSQDDDDRKDAAPIEFDAAIFGDDDEDSEIHQEVGKAASSHNVMSGSVNHGSTAPKTREVDFRKLKQTGASTPTAKVMAVPAQEYAPHEQVREVVATPPTPKPSRPNVRALADWMNDGLAQVGKQRTVQIIDTYATGGKLTEETKNSLMQLVAVADDAEPDAPVGSREMLTLMVALDQILDH